MRVVLVSVCVALGFYVPVLYKVCYLDYSKVNIDVYINPGEGKKT